MRHDCSAPTARTGTRHGAAGLLLLPPPLSLHYARDARPRGDTVSVVAARGPQVCQRRRPVSFDLSNEIKKNILHAWMVGTQHVPDTMDAGTRAYQTRTVRRWQAAGVYPGDEIPGLTIPPS